MTLPLRSVPRCAPALLLAACAATPPMPEPPSSHPASPAAAEAPAAPASDTLVLPARRATPAPPRGRGH